MERQRALALAMTTRSPFQELRVTVPRTAGARVDLLEVAARRLPQLEGRLVHRFTPGLYIRQIHVPKGALVITKIHKTEHPFVVSKGHAAVWTEREGVIQVRAPYCGITRPGTRRVLYIHDDVIWLTFHPTHKTDLAEIEADIIEPHDPTLSLDDETLAALGAGGEGIR